MDNVHPPDEDHAPWTVRQAHRATSQCQVVERVSAVEWLTDTGQWALYADVAVSLPLASKSRGVSPTGVGALETVRLAFPESYPVDPPEISLRDDFPRDFPHIQPWVTVDGRPVPCVVDGPISEFVLSEGLLALLRQIATWLQRAAAGTLMNRGQGWEPVRRDALSDVVVADRAALVSRIDARGGFQCFPSTYVVVHPGAHGEGSSVIVHRDKLRMSVPALKQAIRPDTGLDREFRHGKAIALLIWPGKRADGSLITCDRYLPEDVSNLEQLRVRAKAYGCGQELTEALQTLKGGLTGQGFPEFPLTIILCARRPYPLIGEDSPVELCGYVTSSRALTASHGGDGTPRVRPAGLKDTVSRALLARLSGVEEQKERAPWTLLGAGSLGSKVAVHLARAGQGPAAVVDSAWLSPHNMARHALTPQDAPIGSLLPGGKAQRMKQALETLDQPTRAIETDVVALIEAGRPRGAWTTASRALVNTTAALRVREALAGAPRSVLPVPVIEMLLFAAGRLGVLTLEGEGRNPNTADLMAELYALATEEEDLRRRLHEAASPIERTPVGQGCGSATLRMSDARVSLHAAGMAERLLESQAPGGLEAAGALWLGTLDTNAMGVSWRRESVPAVTLIRPEEHPDWQVRIHARAARKIDAEVAEWPDRETGGLILGRVSEARRTFHVVDVLPAPENSDRRASSFTLDDRGLAAAITAYVERSGMTLTCLGTWHSHLRPSGPSPTDQRTAEALDRARSSPALLLIHAPDGFRAAMGHKGLVRED